MFARKKHQPHCLGAALLCVAVTGTARGAVTDINGLIVQRDTEENDPGGTATNEYLQSNLLINGVALPGTPPTSTININDLGVPYTLFEDSYDNEPADPGFSANRTNAWFTANGTDRYGLVTAEPFEAYVTVNLDTNYFNRNNRKEAGFRFQNPNDPAANSQFLITADFEDGGQVAAFGTSGAFFPLIVFSDIDPVNGLYEVGTDARLGFKYTPAGVNVITDPATYEFTYDPGADDVDIITSGPVNAANFAGFLDGTHLALVAQNHVADGDPDIFGDATTFANEVLDVEFTDITFVDPLAVIAGDYNDSGQVEQGDLDLVLQNWGVDTDVAGVPTGWTNDLPTGQIEQTELDGVLQNWGNTAAPDFSGSSVPEPAGLAALSLLGLGLFGRQTAPRGRK